MNIFERRALLVIRANPRLGLDYVVSLESPAGQRAVMLWYVPDKHLIEPDAWEGYLAALAACPWRGLEEMGLALLDDLANELVPRWLRLRLKAGSQTVTLEDRQPRWDRPGLLPLI